ncbi:hypothetical protein ACFOEK_12270 [Litoribrevibacter euphylliae]|uniref:Uncharacterized protein n=1 Tax=Litoribrevibacter euphylliae TaxID=1834034 RepID=A0ABV7HGQ4_9GAMM
MKVEQTSRGIALIALASIFLVLASNSSDIANYLRSGIEMKRIYMGIWCIVSALVIWHHVICSRDIDYDILIDMVFNIFTLSVAAQSSIMLFKGVVLQTMYDEKYFLNFDQLDLACLFVVSLILILYTLRKMYRYMIEALRFGRSEDMTVEQVKAP